MIAEQEHESSWVFEHLPRVLPAHWSVETTLLDGRRYVNRLRRLVVIVSGTTELDGKRWLHFSMSHGERIPAWEELFEAKEVFLGRDTYAVQVIPPRSKYVNINPHVLHLFSCVDGHPLPDFTQGGNSL